ncbi:DUF881 domain-containing protein [Bifidobacterium avesanii]|uniref:DUF881 domain-containing protein n=1 Tax=Bifidobacterium avesanii TaxID=1798157 RepID=A0A7K3TEF2_9BIFI|nr:DUF881 domain-containing protein [Bifidobacterium avesanii]KAB8295471.1 hypothetical protein DSM100685_0081 [Bifidobacterium avesanii]NEG77477.1 DUF881 domain-containing protein [Bifidobacterium avesanii]
MSAEETPAPVSVPVPADATPVRRRATFSEGALRLSRRHAENSLGIRTQNSTRRRLADESLRLIDDLTNRPMDSLYADSLLDQRHRSAFSIWATRVVVFLICVVVGVSGSVVVQRLHADPRKQQRDWYVSRIEEASDQSDQLTKELNDLRGQITALSDQVGANAADDQLTRDEMVIGGVAVEGPGVQITITNPLSASSDDGSQVRTVTDGDLQWYVSQLWGAGAEAIAVNGNRLGVQSSIRKAGQTILVDLTKIESPYVIQAIGDGAKLKAAVTATGAGGNNEQLENAGIHPQVSTQKTITLEAAESKNLSYARSVE